MIRKICITIIFLILMFNLGAFAGEDKKMTRKGSKVSGIMALIMILAIAGAGAFMYFKSTKKSRRDVTSDPDEDYTENIDASFLEDMNNDNIRNAEDEIDERFDTEEN